MICQILDLPMICLLPDVFRGQTIRMGMLAIFAFGFAGAAISPG
jgi:hypothetical protein